MFFNTLFIGPMNFIQRQVLLLQFYGTDNILISLPDPAITHSTLKTIFLGPGKIVIPDLGKRDVLTLALLFKQVDLFVKNRNEETNKTQTNETIPQQNQTTENQPKRPPKNMYR